MILILTMRGDRTADTVEQLLAKRNADVVRFNPADFPERAACSIVFRRGTGWQRTIERVGAPPIDLAAVTAAWLRRPSARQPPAAISEPRARNYVLGEWHELAAELF